MTSKNAVGQLIEDFSEIYFRFHPGFATFIGIHDYDQFLVPSSKEIWDSFPAELKAWKNRLKKVKLATFSRDEQEDLQLLSKTVEQDLFRHEIQQPRRKDPSYALSDAASWQVGMQFQRDFAPYPERVRNIIALLMQVPKFLPETRDWLQNPVEIWTENAINSADGIPKLYKHIMKTSEGQLPKELLEDLQKAIELASHTVEEHKAWLESNVLPEAKGSWVLGPENYDKLLDIRQIPLTIPEMEDLAQQSLRKTRKQLNTIAEEIIPGGSIEDAAKEVKEDHPSDFEEALKAYNDAMQVTRQFVLDQRLATIPPDEKLHLLETPPDIRPFYPAAAYFPPAKYDPVQEGIFYVTPPETDGKLLKTHNYGNIQLLALHEGYPGHHLQFVCSNRAASFAKILSDWPIETIEGWALYCEWMMQERGFVLSPAAKFAQLRATLWRGARVLIDIQMGTGRMSVKDAATYLVQEAYLEKDHAEGEAKSHTSRPTYFISYLVGAHLIKDLKERAQAHQGTKFDERAFHDLILSSGFLTISGLEHKMQMLDWLPVP